MKKINLKIPEVIKKNFRFATLNFIFIIAFVNIFQTIFGPENSIVGVIFAIMMSASMARDLTAAPLKHLLTQAFVMTGMAGSAFLVSCLPPFPAFIINLTVIFLIIYAFTYEYSSHLYFPYILSYLFLVFISPITLEQLPRRLAGMLAGSVCIMIYQLFMGRNRAVETARDVLTSMIDAVCNSTASILKGNREVADLADLRQTVCQLSRTVYDRRKKILCISDASFSMIDAGRGLEHIVTVMNEIENPSMETGISLFQKIKAQMELYRSFIHEEIPTLPPLDRETFMTGEEPEIADVIYKDLVYVRDRLLHMTDPQKQAHYRKTVLSLKVRLLAALDVSPVRVIYALRVSLLLAFATLGVQLLQLPHGKWLLFTLASLSLPYADDVPAKLRKRITSTITGGLISFVYYSLIPSGAGRTVAMMLSGYVSFYFSDYTQTFACSTLGALGGAVFTSAFGFEEVGLIVLIRLGYICFGAMAAYLANCLLFPYKRSTATLQLWNKYKTVVDLLTRVCRSENVDPQLYYNLVIQAHLQEDKLSQNASAGGWNEIKGALAQCREKVHEAHRLHIAGREDAPTFEWRHLNMKHS